MKSFQNGVKNHRKKIEVRNVDLSVHKHIKGKPNSGFEKKTKSNEVSHILTRNWISKIYRRNLKIWVWPVFTNFLTKLSSKTWFDVKNYELTKNLYFFPSLGFYKSIQSLLALQSLSFESLFKCILFSNKIMEIFKKTQGLGNVFYLAAFNANIVK